MPSFRDLTGQKFERISVISFVTCSPGSHWLCKCDCGVEKVITGHALVLGKTLSCGCLKREQPNRWKHGRYLSRTYKIWGAMKQRCLNPNHIAYQHYGGRGILVCEEWRSDYQNFLSDMGEAPRGLMLERIDNEGSYCKSNCCWATRRIQSLNRRCTVFVIVQGKRIPLMEAAEKAGITWNCADKRLKRGWGTERTFGSISL